MKRVSLESLFTNLNELYIKFIDKNEKNVEINGKNVEILNNNKNLYARALFIFFPILFLLCNNNWIIPSAYRGFGDDWLYTGYFLNLENYNDIFGLLYFSSRLSWILPGYYLYHIFSPLIANYILHLVFFYIALISFFFILKENISEKAAIFTSILLGVYTYFIGELGDDYVFGAGITYFLLTLLMLTFSAKLKQKKLLMFLSGTSFALMLYSHFFTLVFIPTFIGYYLIISKKNNEKFTNFINKSKLVNDSICFLLGGLTLTLLFCILNYKLTGYFPFFVPELKSFFYYSSIKSPFRSPVEAWIKNAHWLILPAIISLIAIWSSFKILQKKKENFFVIFANFSYLSLILIYLIIDFRGGISFQYPFYASFLIPSMFFVIGSQIYSFLEDFNEVQFNFLLTGELFILLSPLANFSYFLRESIFAFTIYNKILILTIFLIFWIGLFVYIVKNAGIGKIAIFSIVLATCTLFSLSNSVAYSETIITGFDTQENGFLAVMDSAHLINEVGEDATFWYDVNEFNNNGDYYGPIFRSINSIYLYSYSYLDQNFPRINSSQNELNKFFFKGLIRSEKAEIKVVIISTKENAYETGKEVLENAGAKVKMLSQEEVKRGNVKFNLTFIEVSMSPKEIFNSIEFFTKEGVGSRVYDEDLGRYVYYSNKSLNSTGYLMYGPYISLPKGFYKVEYNLKVSDVPEENQKVAVVNTINYGNFPNKPNVEKEIYKHDLQGNNYSSVVSPLKVKNENTVYEFTVYKFCPCDLSAFVEITPLTEKEFLEIENYWQQNK